MRSCDAGSGSGSCSVHKEDEEDDMVSTWMGGVRVTTELSII